MKKIFKLIFFLFIIKKPTHLLFSLHYFTKIIYLLLLLLFYHHITKQKQHMESFQNKRFNDNLLFRYLSKSYSKKKSDKFLQSINTTKNLYNKSFKKISNHNKMRSNSSSIKNQLTQSQTISEGYYQEKPGFLKYKKLSINQNSYFNASLSTLNKSLNTWSMNRKSIDQQDFSEFKQPIKNFDINKQSTRNFGLRNVVKAIKNQFRQENAQQNFDKITKDESNELILNEKSRKMFLGHKSYNLDNFLVTQNLRSMNKVRKSIISQTIKTSILRKNLKENHSKQVQLTQA